mgnify:CR=1 FL=1
MKIIFLDIDGVLNNLEHCNWIHTNVKKGGGFGQHWELDRGNFDEITVGWDRRNIDAFMHIVDTTNAKVVISSTWRTGRTVKFFKDCFRTYLNRTPDIINFTDEFSRFRGDEINQYLKHHNYIDSWVCLDDDSDFYPENNLVQTDIQVGLTMDDAKKAIKILGAKEWKKSMQQ